MNGLLTWLQRPEVDRLALVLVHSLWQGALLAVLLALILRFLPARRANVRYAASLACLLAVLIAACGTWSFLGGDGRIEPSPAVRGGSPDRAPPSPTSIVSAPPVANAGAIDRAAQLADWKTKAPPPPPGRAHAPRIAVPEPERPQWAALCVLLWGSGASVMLIRSLSHVAAARRLLQSDPWDEVEPQSLLREVEARLGIRRPVRLLLTRRLPSPAVWGVWKPALLMPAAMASSLTIAELEAIFAHELAHVRRHDHLINLLQMLLESALFFNPAVWWISRQVRVEREACCDRVAALAVRGEVDYACVLANHAQRLLGISNSPGVATAFANETAGGPLLDRVRRLVSPGHRPGMRISWTTCVLLAAAACATLFGLQKGTDVAIKAAEQILSGSERVDAIVREAERAAPEAVQSRPFDEVRIRGRILVDPSLTTVDKVAVSSYVRKTESSAATSSEASFADEFDLTVAAGTIYLFFSHPDAAVSILGPFDPTDGPDIQEQVVFISPGHDVEVRVVDETGRPAAGVQVAASAVVRGNGVGSHHKPTTDARGRATLPHVSPDAEYSLTLQGPGYQKTNPPDGPLPLDSPATFTVARARPAAGTIVNDSGQPVSGVRIRESMRLEEESGGGVRTRFVSGLWEDPLAVTDAEGRFTLDELLDHHRYLLVLEHPDYARGFLMDVEPGQQNLRATLSRGFTVTGQVAGLPADAKRTLRWGQIIHGPFLEGGALGTQHVRVNEPVALDESGRFQLEHVSAGELSFTVEGQRRTARVSEDNSHVTIALDPPPIKATRDVVFRFVEGGRTVKPAGRLRVNGASDQGLQWIPLTDGELRVSAKIPSNAIFAQPEGLIGYWYHPHDVEWPEATEAGRPIIVEIPVYPAGAIHGEVIDVDGAPATGVRAAVAMEFEQKTGTGARMHRDSLTMPCDAQGRFFLTPVPFGARCVMTVNDRYYRQEHDDFVMTPDQPTRSVNIQMQPRRDVAGRLLDTEGKLIVSQSVMLSFRGEITSNSWADAVWTDRLGRFAFPGLNAAAAGQYRVEIRSQRDYVPAIATLDLDGETEIRLSRGLVVEGRTLDEQGQPVPGVHLYATRVEFDPQRHDFYSFEAEAATDAEGRFRFSNLPAVELRFNAREISQEQAPAVDPRVDREVEIHGKVHDWHARQLEGK